MKLSIRTSQQQSPGYTSLALGIAYTDGLLNENQISSACQLACDAFQRSISSAIVSNNSRKQQAKRQTTSQETPEGTTLDEILEQILRQGSHPVGVSTLG